MAGAVSLQNITMPSNIILGTYITQYSTCKDTGLKSTLGPQCGENINNNKNWLTHPVKLPQCHTTRLQVGSGWGSKPPKHCYGFIHDLRHITVVFMTGLLLPNAKPKIA